MKLRYVAKTTANGYSFVFRNVLEFKYLADKNFLSVQLQGKRLDLHGVTSFEGGGDFEPWGDDYAMIPPEDGNDAVKPDGDDGFALILASRTATFDGVEIKVSDNSTNDILNLFSKSREVYADGRLVKSSRASMPEFEFRREIPVPAELAMTTFAPLESLH